ncbi:hypothetical protein GCM10023196_026110 [Actinoallomurus vinaceus]|uniref:PBP domain-containing protein n=2 Tax=Actinoallomurus vinaceus TaxID=1080074 RepID=A0ABP8U6E7_9ACTN
MALVLALLGLVSIGLGVQTLAAPLPPATAASSAVTVPWKLGSVDGSITVSQTRDLVYQTLDVSWKGNFPQTSPQPEAKDTLNAMVVMQCRGTEPSRDDCYFFNREYWSIDQDGNLQSGHSDFRDAKGNPLVVYQLNPSSNEVYGITGADGGGRATMEIRTATQLPELGCTRKTDAKGTEVPACSLVIVPTLGYLDGSFNDDPGSDAFSSYNWDHKVVVPLSFAPTPSMCSLRNPDTTVEGGTAAQRVMEAWQPKLCSQKNRVDVAYNRNGEPQARDLFKNGAADAALTIRPLGGDVTRAHTYAPLAISGFGIGFLLDDANGHQVTGLNLNARLLAKVLTQSYGVRSNNPATTGNPTNFGSDPELRALNPGLPERAGNLGNPILLGGGTDLLWDLTRWIGSDADARAFLDGRPDPWDMHVSTYYKGITLPEDTLELRDGLTDKVGTCTYAPVQDKYPTASSVGAVAQALIGRLPLTRLGPATDPSTGACTQGADTAQSIGGRFLLGLLDTSEAVPLNIPMAKVKNPRGAFVAPTPAAMTSAVGAMVTGSDKITKSVDFGRLPADAYPLTNVTYSAVPTSGLTSAKANALGTFLDHAAGAGQVPGTQLGDLPAGYLPLSSAMKAQTRAAAAAVRKAVAKAPKPSPSHSHHSGSGSGSGSGAGGGSGPLTAGSATPTTTSATTASPTGAAQHPGPSITPARYSLARRGRPTVASSLRFALPVLLGLGLLAGAASLVVRDLRRPGSLLRAALARVPGRS